VDQVMSAIGHFFPDASSSTRLKKHFFGVGGYFSPLANGESLVLRALVTHPAGEAVSEDTALIRSRAALLTHSDDQSAVRIAIEASNIGNERAKEFLDGFADGLHLKPYLVPQLSLSFVLDLIKKHPTLLGSPDVWIGPSERQLALASHIPPIPNTAAFCVELTRAILVATAWPALSSVLARCGYEAVRTVTEWIDNVPGSKVSVPDLVSNSLHEQRLLLPQILSREEVGARVLRIISSIVDPRIESIRSLGPATWRALASSEVALVSAAAQVRSDTFLLSLGLAVSESQEGDVELVRTGFSTVYNAARDDRLDEEIWRYIDPYLPWYLVTWDRCARLIRGVVHLFVDRRWPASEFVATFRTDEQFRRALEEAERTTTGTRYIRQMCGCLREGSIIVDELHEKILKPYCNRMSTRSNPKKSRPNW
jgi:hypothetical protein